MILNIPICTLGAVTCPHISVVRGFPGHKARACLVNGRCCHGYSGSSWRSGNPAWAGVGERASPSCSQPGPYWGTRDTSSNKDMVLPVGDLWDWSNLEPQVLGRGSLRLHELTPTPPTQSYHCFLPEVLISLPIHQQPLVAKWYTATLQGSFTSPW